MHEYSLVQALLDRVQKEAQKHHARTVDRIELSIGELAGVEPDLLVSAFEMLRTDSICSRATLALRTVPARWTCTACDWERGNRGALQCPRCGGAARLATGDELILERIEMEATRGV